MPARYTKRIARGEDMEFKCSKHTFSLGIGGGIFIQELWRGEGKEVAHHVRRNGGENASGTNIDVGNEYSEQCGVDKLESYDDEHPVHFHAPYQWTRVLVTLSNRSGA